jgi:hypothetical protein
MKKRAIIKYDFNSESWVAEFEGVDQGPIGYGDSPELAIYWLTRECNKHDLWEYR